MKENIIKISCAAKIIQNLGISLNELIIYGENHRRFSDSVDNIEKSIKEYISLLQGSSNLIYIIRDDQLEFQGVPLSKIDENGKRTVKYLEGGKFFGILIKSDIEKEDIKKLVQSLQNNLRNAQKGLPAENEGGKSSRYWLFNKDEIGTLNRNGPNLAVEDTNSNLLIPEFQVSEDSYNSIIKSCRSISMTQESGFAFDYEQLSQTSSQVLSLISEVANPRSNVFSKRYFDDFSFHHSINVCLITTKVASRMLNDDEQLRRISIAALLHDVGKSNIPAEIIHKPGRLTDAEFECIKSHPVYGAEILLGVEGIDPMCVAVAFGHHMYQGNKSYPKTDIQFPVDWITKLISVVDIYEALTAYRPYKKGLSPEKAFKVLFSMPGLRDRIKILKMLYECLGPYPEGTFIELSSGERGIVIRQNQKHPYKPLVKILTEPDRTPIRPSRDIDLADEAVNLKIDRTLIPQDPGCNPLEEEMGEEPNQILGRPLSDDQVLMEREG